MAVKRIALLGATGSIGESALSVVAAHPERFKVVAMAAGGNVDRIVKQARQFRPEVIALRNPDAADRAAAALESLDIPVLSGEEGVAKVAAWPSAEMTLSAIVGAAGLNPTLTAVRAGKDIALANKECLVMAGALFMEEVARHKVKLLPVDSEHSAIFQVFEQGPGVSKLQLTASGGPFRGWSRERLQHVTPEQALAHPNWSMGPKISIDSATLMNKGLEVIEAYWLFGQPDPSDIEVIIHPESIVHSMVAYRDGSVLAQMGVPDMRTPIAVALAWPERITAPVDRLDLIQIAHLTFEAPNWEAFPCLGLAFQALRAGGAAPAVLNAANEEAVSAFLSGQITFLDIPRLLESCLSDISNQQVDSLDVLLAVDKTARQWAQTWIMQHGAPREVV